MLTNDVFLIVLLSAALNAGWNSAIKVGGDRITAMAITTLAGSGLSLLALPWVDMPAATSWSLLVLSIVVHTAYHFALPVAYNHGDMGQVYPIARGSAPLLVMLGAALFAGEWPSSGALWGVTCLCAGVLSLALVRSAGHRASQRRAVGYALLTGVLIAAYTVVDALGARQAGSAIGFAVMLTLGDGIATALIVLLWKGPRTFCVDRAMLLRCGAAGSMQMGAYWIAVWALARAPMGAVSALRETSVLLVALISTWLLKERMGAARMVSVALVCAGLLMVRLSS
ncbi:DMT family transporter [Acidovorax sp. sic0104]|uniref:DMT family transporter n=1 Tax=Acidovorax sp. sic0104 TaxID=2854784 RepID=UPI001C44C1DF|nr:DMT family transporter [Acidovorax sp. sic0104]MBV7540819.1 DMT family transporter [Acidovorax sp. sic0104]